MMGCCCWRRDGFWWLILVLILSNVMAASRVTGVRQRQTKGAAAVPGSNTDEQTVEQMWLSCGLDLVAIAEEVENSGSYPYKDILQDRTNFKQNKALLSAGQIRVAISLLSPKVNRSFLDCLIKHNFPLDTCGEDNLRSWFVAYLEASNSRRYLAEDVKPKHVRSKEEEEEIQKEIAENESKTIMLVVALTAGVTSLAVGIMFCCFLKFRSGSSFGSSRKEEWPLLSLSLSDLSGSSRSFGGNSTNGLLAPPKPLKTDPSQKLNGSSLESVDEVPPSQSDEPPLEEVNYTIPSEPSKDHTVISEPTPPPPPPTPTPPSLPVMPPPFEKPDIPPAPPPGASSPVPGPPPLLPPKGGDPRPLPPCKGPPPPPPKGGAPRPPPGKPNMIKGKGPPPAPRKLGEADYDSDAPKAKLKPFFWDKVNAKPNQSMVWDRLKAGSFQFDEEMIESLFGFTEQSKEGKKAMSVKDNAPQYVILLDPKKSQNLSISLKALNVRSVDVRDAITEGNELPIELLATLLKMAPTIEEELKIRLYDQPARLGPAEQFIRAIVDVPYAYERLDVLLFMTSLPEEVLTIKESFQAIEVACKELRNSRLFLKLLEAVLKTGNRMNHGTYRGAAQAFKLDTLLKLADVRETDGKTTLLHFVVQEIIRTEGLRAMRVARESRTSICSISGEDLLEDLSVESEDLCRTLGFEVVTGLSGELDNVKKAAGLDADGLTHTVVSLGERLIKAKEFLKSKMETSDEESRFLDSLRGFVGHAETSITALLEEEKTVRLLLKTTSDYFHGNSGKDEGLRLFVIVRDFLGMIEKVCRELKALQSQKPAPKPKEKPAITPAQHPTSAPARDPPLVSPARNPRELLFPAVKVQRSDSFSSSSSDDDAPKTEATETPAIKPVQDPPTASPAKDPPLVTALRGQCELLFPAVKVQRSDSFSSSSPDDDAPKTEATETPAIKPVRDPPTASPAKDPPLVTALRGPRELLFPAVKVQRSDSFSSSSSDDDAPKTEATETPAIKPVRDPPTTSPAKDPPLVTALRDPCELLFPAVKVQRSDSFSSSSSDEGPPTPKPKQTPAITPVRDPPTASPAKDPPLVAALRDPRELLFPAVKVQRSDSFSSNSSDEDPPTPKPKETPAITPVQDPPTASPPTKDPPLVTPVQDPRELLFPAVKVLQSDSFSSSSLDGDPPTLKAK